MIMETDVGTVDPNRIDFQGLRNEAYQTLDEEEPTIIPQQSHPPQAPPSQSQWDPVQYYNIPPQQNDKRDIFADMDRTMYIIIAVAFVIGFFIGRGMVQPVILRGH
jgi:hypothetical protein